MSTSLSSLVDNLSEIYENECKVCKEKGKIKSVCNFIGLENNKLKYEYKECEKRSLKPINELVKKFSNVYQFCQEDINKFALLLRKGVIHMTTLIAGKDLMQHHYQIRKVFIVNCI